MAPTTLIKFCGFIVSSKPNNMALSTFPRKIPETNFFFCPSPNVEPEPSDKSRSNSIYSVLSQISLFLVFVSDIPLKLRVGHTRKILIFYFLKNDSNDFDQILWVYSTFETQQYDTIARSGPGFDPRSGQVSWVRFFRGFSSPVRQMSGSFRPPRSPPMTWDVDAPYNLKYPSIHPWHYRLSRKHPWNKKSRLFFNFPT